MAQKCAVCKQNASQSCSSCQSVAYCSVEHQRKHWHIHRKYCPYFQIKDDPELGKGLVASRDIKAGTILLEELPVISSPTWDAPSCMACGSVFTMFKLQQSCSRCAWPVCGLTCEKLPAHANNECKLFSKKGFRYPPPFKADNQIISMFTRLVRAYCLKKQRAEIHQKILDLSWELNLPEAGKTGEEQFEKLIKPELRNLGLDLVDEEGKKLHGIMSINCHTATDYFGRKKNSATNLYIKVSRINHSCIPNCSWLINEAPEFKIRVRTATAVPKGEPLTVSYYHNEVMYATKYRQERILKSGYQCKCARCMDPTELGTYSSAIVCKPCQPKKSESIGYFLPENPLDLSDGAAWKCNHCGTIKTASEILAPVEALGKTVEEDFQDDKIPDGKTLMEKCKKFITKHSGKSLHPNHWVIQNVMRAFLDYFSGRQNQSRFGRMDPEIRKYFVECGWYMLAIYDVILPGLSTDRANLQLWMGYVVHAQEIGLMNERRYLEAHTLLQQILDLQKEALKYFEGEFPKKDGRLSSADALKNNIECVDDDLMFLLRVDLNNFEMSRS